MTKVSKSWPTLKMAAVKKREPKARPSARIREGCLLPPTTCTVSKPAPVGVMLVREDHDTEKGEKHK